jgi:hypothetical protein
MTQANKERGRGLPSLEQSRLQRRRAVVLGRVRLREAAPQFWLWTAVLFLAFGVIYWHWSERELGRQKAAVMAKQRAVAQELQPRLVPLRDKVEAWVMELAGSWQPVVSPKLNLEELSTSRGLYLRLLQRSADSSEEIRKAAQTSLHDGFTSCMFVRQERMKEGEGAKCFSPSQCPDGELCNDWGICSPPTQPFNLRLMYGAMRLLSPAWTDELHAATSDYQLRVFERDLEKVVKTDVRIALELTETARYFTALLDETPKEGISRHPEGSDAGLLARPELRVQGQAHGVRIGIWDLQSGDLLLRHRFEAGVRFVPMGRSQSASQHSLDAQQRQANNCALAADVKDLVNKSRTDAAGALPAGTAATP